MFKIVAVAGTFDHLHRGHEYFISGAFKLGERVVIGLMSDEYVRQKFSIKSKIQNYKALRHLEGREGGEDTSDGGRAKGEDSSEVEGFVKRKEGLINFLRKEKLLDRAEIVQINDIYGPAVKDKKIEALVVTEDTWPNALLVNQKRQKFGLKSLKLLKMPLIKARDKRKISSSRIRKGEIDREGYTIKPISKSKPSVIARSEATWQSRANARKQVARFLASARNDKLTPLRGPISESLRQELKKPQGRLIKGDPENHQLIAGELKEILNKLQPVMITTIGDEVTKLCNKIGIEINLAIFDFKVRRKKIYRSLFDLQFHPLQGVTLLKGDTLKGVRNPAGSITPSLIRAIKKAYPAILRGEKQQLIKIIGEDDLAGVPAILFSPLGGVVIYGQPNEGIVVVKVTEEKKKQLHEIMTKLRQPGFDMEVV